MGRTVLVIHDSRQLRAKARAALEQAGHEVHEARVGTLSRDILACRPDMVMCPWTDAITMRELLARLRSTDATRDARTIVIAPREDIHRAVAALDFGADDCLAAPFTGEELVARVNASLRRPALAPASAAVRAGPILLDKTAHCIFVHQEIVEMAPAEYRLIAFFLENDGRVFSRQELLERVWPKHIKAGPRTVDVHVRRVRQALERFGCDDMIQTVRGFGYRFSTAMRPSRPAADANPAVTSIRQP